MIRDGFVTIRGFAPGNHGLTSLYNARWYVPSKPDTSSTNQSPRITHVHPDVVSAELVFDKQV